jgi:uncharacterized protein YxjI
MRTLYLRDRATDESTTIVHDQANNACYLVTGKWGLRHDALSLYTMQGRLLAEVKQLGLGLMPKFALYLGSQRVGTIGKTLGFVSEVVYIHGLNWVIVGNALTNHYRVFRNTTQVFRMDPDQATGGYYLTITVNQEADEPLAILVAYVLNHWAHRKLKAPRKVRHWGFKHSAIPGMATSLNDHCFDHLNQLLNK